MCERVEISCNACSQHDAGGTNVATLGSVDLSDQFHGFWRQHAFSCFISEINKKFLALRQTWGCVHWLLVTLLDLL